MKINKITEGLEDSKEKNENYMFFSNLEHICRMAGEILDMDNEEVDQLLKDHDWANDHISKSMESVQHVYNFLLACKNGEEPVIPEMENDITSDEEVSETGEMMDEVEAEYESKITKFSDFK
jgi:hypothetical protein